MTSHHDGITLESYMLRTQIQLTEDQHRRVRMAAQEAGISVAEMIRRCIERYFVDEAPDRGELYARAMRLAGQFKDRDGATDVSERHDDYLDEAYL